jgi:hypothetical protein
MFPLKVAVILIAVTISGSSAALVGYDIYLATQLNRLLPRRRRPCRDVLLRPPANCARAAPRSLLPTPEHMKFK